MKPNTELKILKLCKGMTIAQAERRMSLMNSYVKLRQTQALKLKIKLVGLI